MLLFIVGCAASTKDLYVSESDESYYIIDGLDELIKRVSNSESDGNFKVSVFIGSSSISKLIERADNRSRTKVNIYKVQLDIKDMEFMYTAKTKYYVKGPDERGHYGCRDDIWTNSTWPDDTDPLVKIPMEEHNKMCLAWIKSLKKRDFTKNELNKIQKRINK